jgi:hypothetical protein
MTISAHGSLDGLCLFHAKLLEYVMCIQHLANESSLFDFLIQNLRKNMRTPIIFISNLSIMILLNSSQKDLLV